MKKNTKSIFFVEINTKQGEKKKISPIGIGVQGFDGRTFDIDGKAVVDFNIKQSIDIYIDEDHRGGKAKGWIYLDTLELKEDGIYAEVDFTPEGQALVDDKSYRYFSPAYIMGDNRTVLGIESVALCNTPNLLSKAINNKENNIMTPEEIKALVEELIKQAFEKLKQETPAEGDVEKAVEEVKAIVEEVKETAKEVEELKAEIIEANKQTRENRVDAAIASGRLEANKREFALSLNSAQFHSFLELSRNDKSHLKKPVNFEKNSIVDVDETVADINRQLGL